MVEDEEESTKVAEKTEVMEDSNGTEALGSGETEEPGDSIERSPKAPELPTEVRTKLRKLEKLEGRYQGRIVARCGKSDLTVVQSF